MTKACGRLFIVSGPSGAGKSTLTKLALELIDGLGFSVSYTTRKPRQGEVDGEDYVFVDDAKFDAMVAKGEFLEHAGVHGKKYGTREADLRKILASGSDVLLDIDVQGAEQVAKKVKEAVLIFILPPSMEECEKRLASRGKMDDEELKKRVENARGEIKSAPYYDYVILNDDVDAAYHVLRAIITAERVKREAVLDAYRDKFEF